LFGKNSIWNKSVDEFGFGLVVEGVQRARDFGGGWRWRGRGNFELRIENFGFGFGIGVGGGEVIFGGFQAIFGFI
jgi:hypothetical protein